MPFSCCRAPFFRLTETALIDLAVKSRLPVIVYNA